GTETSPDMGAVAVNSTTPPVEKDPVEKKPELTPEQKLDKDLDSIERMLNREQYGKAKSRIGKIAKDHPNNGRVAALAGRSEVYDNSARAIREINRAKGLGYNSAEMYLDLATAYFLSGNKGQAKSTYETFLKRYPKHKRAGEIRAILKNQF
ncbi:MAG: tetratricopeptide repeat protein, partial [Myxococcota bacterium]|nr:tetratricopeptide repeat protein [Myxococcota bacterium]